MINLDYIIILPVILGIKLFYSFNMIEENEKSDKGSKEEAGRLVKLPEEIECIRKNDKDGSGISEKSNKLAQAPKRPVLQFL